MINQCNLSGSRALLAACALAATNFANGQLPVSRQAAVLPVSATGGGAATQVGIPFTREPVARDVVAAVSGQDITGTSGGFTPSAFANNGNVLVIVSGAGRGTALPITGNTATTFTVTGTVPALTSNVDEFEITPLPTIGSVFGDSLTGGPFDLTGAPSSGGADLLVINGVRYFYKTAGQGGAGWKLESAANVAGDLGGTAFANLRGVNVIRRAATKLVGVRGITRNGRVGLPVPTGTNLLSWPFPSEVTLIDSGLQNTIQGAPSAAAADKVVINGIRYFYKTAGQGGASWKRETLANEQAPGQNSTILNPGGRAFYILRSGAEVTHPVNEQYAQ